MRDAIVMWRSTKLAVLSALCAAFYAALLIPFKPIPLIPGFTEIRPGNVVPVVTGILFGPAAAWGCAFGNLIADFFGTIGPGSIFGFIGNFLLAYIPYRLWRIFARGRIATGAPADAPLFMLVVTIGSMSCAVVIGWGLEILGLVPYEVLAAVITINNTWAGILLGLLLLPLMYPRARRWGLLYQDLMQPDEYREGALAPVGALLVCIGSIGGALLAVEMFLASKIPSIAPIVSEDFPFQYVAHACALMIFAGCVMFTRKQAATQQIAAPQAEEIDESAMPLQVTDLRFRYALGDGPALDGITLSQNRGTLRVLMGRTGAGKSTLCKCLNGAIPMLEAGDFAGQVRLYGRDIAGVPVHALAPVIGEVFQDFESQLLTSSVEAEVAFPLENIGVPLEEMRRRVQTALEQVEVWNLRDREPGALSGGEKQRLALAATLVTEPRIIVLDEPTTDLDPAGKQELLSVCAGLRGQGRTIVLAEHDSDLAVDADSLTVLQDGKVAYDGPPCELLADPSRSESLGLRRLDLPALFEALGRPERPLRVEEAEPLLRGAELDEKAWEEVSTPWMSDAYRDGAEGLERPILSVRGLRYVYPGGVEAIKLVSFDVYAGEFVAVIGENGSGKTTLSKHLNGLLKPTEGEVYVSGKDTRKHPASELAAIAGYLFQDPDHQIFAETVQEEVAFGPVNVGVAAEKLPARVNQALAAVGLEGMGDADPFTLTKGQRQQVALASVLAMKPRVILFDEPTTGLDGPEQRRMLEHLRELNAAGHTIIMTTHCPWAVAEYAHRVLAMADGELIADGPTREVFSNPDALARAGQRLPQITQLSQRVWGKTLLSVSEAVSCLGGEAG